MKPFFSFYGGKWRGAKYYPAPLHATIVEPFAGSAGYSVRHYERNVILCEKDPVIYGVWDYLLRATPAEIMRLPLLRAGDKISDLPAQVPQEARWLIGFLVNGAAAAPCNTPSSWMRRVLSGEHPQSASSFWGESRRARIASQVEKIKHWKVYNRSWEDCPIPRGSATWFVDPPYQDMGKHYVYGSDGIDYEALGAWCRSRRGQVIACEGVGATWLPFRPLREIRSATCEGGKPRRFMEAIWTND